MKILRAYIMTAAVCISITSIIAGMFVADENAKKISLGQEYAVVMLSGEGKLREDAVNPLPLIEKIADGAKKAASLAPPPISNIYWFISNLKTEEIQK